MNNKEEVENLRFGGGGGVEGDYDSNDEEDNGPDLKLVEISIEEGVNRLGYGAFQIMIMTALGLCSISDAMETLILTILSVVLKSIWGLSTNETAFLTSSVFFGAVAGTLVLGPLADQIGRRPVYLICSISIATFGFATSFCNSYAWLVFTRSLVGFGIGGVTIPFDTLAELVPVSSRGQNLACVEYYWTSGTLLVVIFAYFTLNNEALDSNTAWRYFVALCAIPCVLSVIMGLCMVPESPRWLCSQGRREEAMDILRRVARINGMEPYSVFPEYCVLKEEPKEGSACLKLLSPKWRRITIMLWIVWFSVGVMYYGNILFTTLLFSSDSDDDDDVSSTTVGYSFDYSDLAITCSAEYVGTTLVILTIDSLGRIPTQAFSYLCGGACILGTALSYTYGNDALTITFAFLARMLIMSGYCVIWLGTAEIFTTNVRATGHSTANALGKMGGVIAPYVVEDLATNTIGWIMLTVAVITAIVVLQLPETRGRPMGILTIVPSGDANPHLCSNNNDGALEVSADVRSVKELRPVSTRSDRLT
eukprot:CAMPEP_0202446786 /NCGR_PEP_ID=MMETSP1360-20130828/5359_1 /ASSEMBLY_ACC=CAM_ASM_000848 /TAXON_ID=515479 /ORGANISM="Licmophora paradoxa, Strain CCMP2313" /LENGTH=535 /DNA_ID=CAMNT_0049063473 /DNA_START=124 /DNA_END=1731 /DNA_ORIENTATION=-